nr:immunoglobulin heavy chain junction region [Mus musculus]MBK4188970.1 immunoglobulin heavy chain junction region [Mus musculus]MBK4188971.1 immunoglobulin heavy chain junction region [Mus musculus]MBK4188972.1 immunoglobulin heavy chain junction region [Mus musculus]MBK4188973.1 immunoglobulin heavy chain junction region [Mus musculus]
CARDDYDDYAMDYW